MERQVSVPNINFVQLVMAKQSSIFNFFTKSPPAVAKTKSNPSPTEADLPSVTKSSSSPKEEAKHAAPSSRKSAEKSTKVLAKVGHGKIFGQRVTDANQRWGENKHLSLSYVCGECLQSLCFAE